MGSQILVLVMICILSVTWVTTVDATIPKFVVPTWDTGDILLSEDANLGDSVITVEAEDMDGDTLTFAIVEQYPVTPMFLLDPSSGLLTAPNNLDAEEQQLYSLKFSVSDGISTVYSEHLSVVLDDVNEFAPVFDQTYYSAVIEEIAENGNYVTKVSARDRDITSKVYYSFVSGNDFDTFAIDGWSGEVTVRNSTNLDMSLKPVFNLNIRATDKEKSSNAMLTIAVYEDSCPSFPCKNGGKCYATYSSSSFECSCAYGFTGSVCETVVDNCRYNPCPRGTVCQNSIGSYKCTCAYGYSGASCEKDLSITIGASVMEEEAKNYWWISLIVVGVLGIGLAVPFILHKLGTIDLSNNPVCSMCVQARDSNSDPSEVINYGNGQYKGVKQKGNAMAVTRV